MRFLGRRDDDCSVMHDACSGECKPEARATAWDEDTRAIKLWGVGSAACHLECSGYDWN